MGSHINEDGFFQSDKYPTCPPGKVPLSCRDATAQDLLWEYAQRRRAVDPEFSADLETALRSAGYAPPTHVCFACQSVATGERRPSLEPTPVCVKCGELCTSGCWVVKETFEGGGR
jgi:hypothetical protein